MQMKFESARAGEMILWHRPASCERAKIGRRQPFLTMSHEVFSGQGWENAVWAAIALSALAALALSFAS
jgi:hypothetical protein